jgi:hypothetical protein
MYRISIEKEMTRSFNKLLLYSEPGIGVLYRPYGPNTHIKQEDHAVSEDPPRGTFHS